MIFRWKLTSNPNSHRQNEQNNHNELKNLEEINIKEPERFLLFLLSPREGSLEDNLRDCRDLENEMITFNSFVTSP